MRDLVTRQIEREAFTGANDPLRDRIEPDLDTGLADMACEGLRGFA